MSIFASTLNNSPDRCGLVPRPAEPKVMVPGFALASAMNSFTVFAGTDGCTVRMFGDSTTSEIGAKSRSASYGSFAYMLGLIASVDRPISSV